MINTLYCTPSEYRNIIRRTDPARDEDVEDDLFAVSRLIDRELKRFFSLDEELVIRYFMSHYIGGKINAEAENPWIGLRGEYDLSVNDIADATGLVIRVDTNRDQTFATTLTASQFQLYPRNALVGPEPRPYTHIHRVDQQVWLPGVEVEVTAKWGWPHIPKAIKSATAHMTGILRIESPRATSRISEMEGIVKASDECQKILEKLKATYERKARF